MEQEIKLLVARASDAVRLCELRNAPKFLGFLSPGEATAVSCCVKAKNTYFFGGYDDAERRVFGVLPDYLDDVELAFPIKALSISYRNAFKLTHRDVLGSIMATGISRDRIGDICVLDGLAIAFVLDEVANYLAEQITKIGRVGVEVSVIPAEEAKFKIPPPKRQEISFTVSTPRLDAIISSLVGCSRSKAEQLILDGTVFIDSFAVTKTTKLVKVGDKISVRGVGKFVIVSTGDFSKKGREIIVAEKYI